VQRQAACGNGMRHYRNRFEGNEPIYHCHGYRPQRLYPERGFLAELPGRILLPERFGKRAFGSEESGRDAGKGRFLGKIFGNGKASGGSFRR